MISLRSYRHLMTDQAKAKPWLVIGKGPSADKLKDIPVHKFNCIALNHAINVAPFSNYVHVTDYDVLGGILNVMSWNSKAKLICPFLFHHNNKPSKNHCVSNLLASKEDDDVIHLLNELHGSDSLGVYNSSLSYGKTIDEKKLGPVITVRYFSSVAVVNILASLDVKNITLIGIDGGTEYSKMFSEHTPLTNGRQSFDIQFDEINKTVKRHSIVLERIT
jgi:hypothetical protein